MPMHESMQMLMRTTHVSRPNMAATGLAFVLLAAGVVHTFPVAATEHPSLCIRRAELAGLRDKTLVPGIPAEMWDEVRAAAEEAVNEPVVAFAGKTDNETSASVTARAAARNMELLSLAYLVTGEERFARRATETALAAAAARTWVDRDTLQTARAAAKERYEDDQIPPFHYADVMAGVLSRGIGFVYDWLYDYLSPVDRDRLRSAAVEKGIRPVLEDLGHGIWWAEQRHSRGAETICGIGVAALSFLDEEAEASRWVSEAKRWTAEYLSRQGTDGGYAGGLAHWNDGIGAAVIFIEALRTRLGDADLYRHPYLRKTLEFALYTTMPDKLSVVNFGRCPYGAAYRGTWFVWRLASRYRHGVAQWNSTRIWRAVRARYRDESPYRNWRRVNWDFLWYDPTVDVRDPYGYPSAKHFRGIDWVVLRGGWSDKDVLVAMRSGEITGFRPSLDLNNVILTAYGRTVLVNRYVADTAPIDSGTYNCVLIDGAGQTVPAAGTILEFRDERGYNYACADATAAYGKGIIRVHRHLIFVKPAYLVVIDDIATDEPARVEQRWHTVDRIDTTDTFATLHSGDVTLRVEPVPLDEQPANLEVRTDIPTEPAGNGPDVARPLPYLCVRSIRPVKRYTLVTVLTPGLDRSRSYHPHVEGSPDRFTVKLKRNQWRDTIEFQRAAGRLSATVKFEPALKLPPIRDQRSRDRSRPGPAVLRPR